MTSKVLRIKLLGFKIARYSFWVAVFDLCVVGGTVFGLRFLACVWYGFWFLACVCGAVFGLRGTPKRHSLFSTIWGII